MEKLVLDGKTYIKASAAAKQAGYTADYVGQLCRGKKVDAQLVGRSWYVNEEALKTHQVEKKRSSRKKAREQVRRSLAEAGSNQVSIHKKTEPASYEKHITYEEDTADLIPSPRRIQVESEPLQKKTALAKEKRKAVEEEDTAPNYTLENKGQKVVMSGSLEILDATDEDLLDENVIMLHAKVLSDAEKKKAEKQAQKITAKKTKSAPTQEVVVETTGQPTQNKGSDFYSKLLEHDVDTDIKVVSDEKEEEQGDSTVEQTAVLPVEVPVTIEEDVVETVRVWPVVFGVTVIALVLATFSLGFDVEWSYSPENWPEYFTVTHPFSFENILTKLGL